MDTYEIADAIIDLMQEKGWNVDRAMNEIERAVSINLEPGEG